MTALLLAAAGVGMDTAAIGMLIAAAASALVSLRLVGPNRKKVIEETTSSATERATHALEVALANYEKYNARLRGDVDDLEERIDTCTERLVNVTAERDELARRIERMSAQLAAAGIRPAT